MAKQKYTFPGPSCPGCQYHQTVGCTRYCNGFPKRRKPRRFRKSDPKYKPPKWCPRLLSPSVCRVYGFADEKSEYMDWMLNQKAAAVERGNEQDTHLSVLEPRYKLRLELPLGLTAKQFYDEMQSMASTCVTEEIRNQVNYGEVIEIDDGLKPYYFYFTNFKVIPLAYFDCSRAQPAAPAPSEEGGERE